MDDKFLKVSIENIDKAILKLQFLTDSVVLLKEDYEEDKEFFGWYSSIKDVLLDLEKVKSSLDKRVK